MMNERMDGWTGGRTDGRMDGGRQAGSMSKLELGELPRRLGKRAHHLRCCLIRVTPQDRRQAGRHAPAAISSRQFNQAVDI